MYFYLIPLLEYISIVKIVVRLWDQYEDIKQEVNSDRDDYFKNDTSWLDVEEKVIRKVKMLSLPLEIRKKIIPLIKPIGFEVIKWIMFLRENMFIPIEYIIRTLNELHWTQLGKIDRRKTAEILIRDESIHIGYRCRLAYIYCFQFDHSVLECNDLHLFMQSNVRIKRRFINLFKNPDKIVDEPLVDYWSSGRGCTGFRLFYSGSKRYPNSTRYQRAFENAAYNGYKAATEYFFQKLSKKEKRESLLRSVENIISISSSERRYDYVSYDSPDHGFYKEYISEYIDVFYFLFLQMHEHEQMLVLQSNAFCILTYFLNWPWQNLFIQTSQFTWSYVNVEQFKILLERIAALSQKGFEYYDYRNLFTNYWKQSPKSFKNHITDNIPSTKYNIYSSTQLLPTLFKIKDEKNIKLILDDLTSAEKKKLFFSNMAMHIWIECIENCDWCALELFIQQCMSSDDGIVIARKLLLEIIKPIKSMNEDFEEKHVFQLLRDFIENTDTIKEIEEERSNPA